jgi:hypothetical protein
MHLESATGECNVCPISIWLCWPNVNNMDIGHNLRRIEWKLRVSKLAYLVYKHFKDGDKWPELVKLVSHRLKKFKNHLTSKWATLAPFSSIIIEKWLELKTYCKNIIHHKRLIKDLQKYPHTNERWGNLWSKTSHSILRPIPVKPFFLPSYVKSEKLATFKS